MAITICGSSIGFGSNTLSTCSPGFEFNGVITACQGFCDLRPEIQGADYVYWTTGSPLGTASNDIDRFSFATGGAATDVGELQCCRAESSGASSGTNGYVLGGKINPGAYASEIYKFPFGSGVTSTCAGSIGTARVQVVAHQAPSYGCGFVSAGFCAPPYASFSCISTFPFASDSPATCVGQMTSTYTYSYASSSVDAGFILGGQTPPGTYVDVIQCFPFASTGNATDVGEAASPYRGLGSSAMSVTHGYGIGGDGCALCCQIIKYPFAASTSSTNVASLAQTARIGGGGSSHVCGYTAGGQSPACSPGTTDVIQAFPFSSDTPASCVGTLTRKEFWGVDNIND